MVELPATAAPERLRLRCVRRPSGPSSATAVDRASGLDRAPTAQAARSYLGIERRQTADRRATRRAPRRADQGQRAGVGALARPAGAEHPGLRLGRGAHGGAHSRPPGAEGSRRRAAHVRHPACGAPFHGAPSRRWWTGRAGVGTTPAGRPKCSAGSGSTRRRSCSIGCSKARRWVSEAFYYDVLGGMPGRLSARHPAAREPTPADGAARRGVAGPAGAAVGVDELAAAADPRRRRRAGRRGPGDRRDPRRLRGRRAAPGAAPPRSAHARRRRRARSGCGAGASWPFCIVACLETERDRDAWQSLVAVLGRLATVERCAALAQRGPDSPKRTPPPGLLDHASASPPSRRSALPLAPTARGTLQRLARDAEGVVRYAADRILEAGRQRAG